MESSEVLMLHVIRWRFHFQRNFNKPSSSALGTKRNLKKTQNKIYSSECVLKKGVMFNNQHGTPYDQILSLSLALSSVSWDDMAFIYLKWFRVITAVGPCLYTSADGATGYPSPNSATPLWQLLAILCWYHVTGIGLWWRWSLCLQLKSIGLSMKSC